MSGAMPSIVGILNLTRDSFSDGGAYLDPAAACEHAQRMTADGAAWIDVGAESTHPDSEDVPAAEEIRRLTPVLERLLAEGLRVSVDTWKPAVMRHALAVGAQAINDVTALREPEAVEAVRASPAMLVLMHSRAGGARAERAAGAGDDVMERILAFFARRLADLESQGIDPARVVVDPGMGFFLGPDAGPSLRVLRELPRLRELGRPIYVSTSRKSFLGSLLGRPVDERGAGTLATELHAWRSGADYVRTHDVRALADGVKVMEAVGGGRA